MSTFYIIRDEDDLTHHGIKGQKWGIRRFQNDDGSLTSAGKTRYGKINKRAQKKYNQLLDQADSMAEYTKRVAKSDQEIHDRLKKEGSKGSLMEEWAGYDMSDSEFDRAFGMSRDDYYKQELSYYKESAKQHARSGEKWTKYAESLRNMDISGMSKKDVKKKAKELQNEAFN